MANSSTISVFTVLGPDVVHLGSPAAAAEAMEVADVLSSDAAILFESSEAPEELVELYQAYQKAIGGRKLADAKAKKNQIAHVVGGLSNPAWQTMRSRAQLFGNNEVHRFAAAIANTFIAHQMQSAKLIPPAGAVTYSNDYLDAELRHQREFLSQTQYFDFNRLTPAILSHMTVEEQLSVGKKAVRIIEMASEQLFRTLKELRPNDLKGWKQAMTVYFEATRTIGRFPVEVQLKPAIDLLFKNLISSATQLVNKMESIHTLYQRLKQGDLPWEEAIRELPDPSVWLERRFDGKGRTTDGGGTLFYRVPHARYELADSLFSWLRLNLPTLKKMEGGWQFQGGRQAAAKPKTFFNPPTWPPDPASDLVLKTYLEMLGWSMQVETTPATITVWLHFDKTLPEPLNSVEREAQKFATPGQFIQEYLASLEGTEDIEPFNTALNLLLWWIKERKRTAASPEDRQAWRDHATSVYQIMSSYPERMSPDWFRHHYSTGRDIFNHRGISFDLDTLPTLLQAEKPPFYISPDTVLMEVGRITPVTRLDDFAPGIPYKFVLVRTASDALELHLGAHNEPHRHMLHGSDNLIAYGDIQFLKPKLFKVTAWNVGESTSARIPIDFMRKILTALYGNSVQVEELQTIKNPHGTIKVWLDFEAPISDLAQMRVHVPRDSADLDDALVKTILKGNHDSKPFQRALQIFREEMSVYYRAHLSPDVSIEKSFVHELLTMGVRFCKNGKLIRRSVAETLPEFQKGAEGWRGIFTRRVRLQAGLQYFLPEAIRFAEAEMLNRGREDEGGGEVIPLPVRVSSEDSPQLPDRPDVFDWLLKVLHALVSS